MTSHIEDTVIWQQLVPSGHDFVQIVSNQENYTIAGTSIFCMNSKNCCLHYTVRCNSNWETRNVSVTGTLNGEFVELEIQVTGDRNWSFNGVEQPGVKGCIDVDLGFTPATNTLPIRRNAIAVGQSFTEIAALLQFPEWNIIPLSQTYQRQSETQYLYSSGNGIFTAKLTVRDSGLVSDYDNYWRQEISK